MSPAPRATDAPLFTPRSPGSARASRPWLLLVWLLPAILAGCGDPSPRSEPEGPRAFDDGENAERPGNTGSGAPGGSAFPARIEDDAGATLDLDAPPERIVSLVPSATGILLALGMRDRLVGRTDYELANGVEDLPSVGGGLNPSMERLVALEPDLVIRFRAESDPETPRQLDAAEIPHLAIRPDRIADVRRIVGLLGEVLGTPERAAELWARIEGELEAVSARVEGMEPPRVVFLGGDPPTVAGPGTFLHELIEIAGGENAFADSDALYAPVSLEEVIRRDVEMILATEGSRIPGALERIPVGRVPIDMLSPGLEVAESARTLAALFHPDRVP